MIKSNIKNGIEKSAVTAISNIVGLNNVLHDKTDCWVYGYDNSRKHTVPDMVVFPGNHAEVGQICQICSANNIPLTARGRGTNTTGASIPKSAGLVLSFDRMNQIKKIDAGNSVMVVQPGVTNGEVQTAAAEHGFFWAPDPTSSKYCTVGGNIATNAAGPRAVKYGTTNEHVLGLYAILGTGETIKTGAYTTKSVVGYDLTRLIIGSEGTLALVTEAILKLTPLPEARTTLSATFQSTQAAANAVTRIMAQPTIPCALEFMDSSAIEIVREYTDLAIAGDIKALLMIEVDGSKNTIADSIAAIKTATSMPGLVNFHIAHNKKEAGSLWQMRKALSPALRKLAPNKINEDVVVPVSMIPALIDGLEALSDRFNIPIVNFGHAGNGNIHVNLLYDSQNKQQAEAAKPCLDKVFELVLELNGSLSGEHGIGYEKREYIKQEIPGVTLNLMWRLKQQFDPVGILNPGKIFPDEFRYTNN